jgi:uncharacterized membrane protein
MDIKDAILYLVNNWISTMLAIVAVAGFIGLVKPIGNSVQHFAFKELYAADDKHDKRLDQLEMQLLKQIICDVSLPIEGRLDAGDVYVGRGGNGAVKARYESLKCVFIRGEQEEA